MPNPVTKKERERIVSLLKEYNGNRNKVAKECGRAPGTIQAIANQEGIPSAYSAPKKAVEARVAYAEERRLEIIGMGFDKSKELLAQIKDAGEFQKWTVGLGTLVDKARLETGEVTNRNENRNTSNSLEDEFKKLDAKLEDEWGAGMEAQGGEEGSS